MYLWGREGGRCARAVWEGREESELGSGNVPRGRERSRGVGAAPWIPGSGEMRQGLREGGGL